jgi:hypothetical protein
VILLVALIGKPSNAWLRQITHLKWLMTISFNLHWLHLCAESLEFGDQVIFNRSKR